MPAKLQHWSLRSGPGAIGHWEPPEQHGARMLGIVTGHPRHHDGKEVFTTPVVRCYANLVVTRSGSEYELGPSDPAYERRYPGALKRLLTTLQHETTEQERAPEPRHGGYASRLARLVASLMS